MLMRTGMAKGSGQPIPDDPSADVLTKIGRGIARGERNRVPLYRGMWVFFLAVGLVLLALAGWAFLAAYVGPGLGVAAAIAAFVVLLWVGAVVGTRLFQKTKMVETKAANRYRLTLTPKGMAVVALLRGKSWVDTPVELYRHLRQDYGAWTVSAELIAGQDAQSAATSEVLSPRVNAAHRYTAITRELQPHNFWG
jgi:hypothetical protein